MNIVRHIRRWLNEECKPSSTHQIYSLTLLLPNLMKLIYSNQGQTWWDFRIEPSGENWENSIESSRLKIAEFSQVGESSQVNSDPKHKSYLNSTLTTYLKRSSYPESLHQFSQFDSQESMSNLFLVISAAVARQAASDLLIVEKLMFYYSGWN